MNRVLKQRFNQISRQNNYFYISRNIQVVRPEAPAGKMMPAATLATTVSPTSATAFPRG